MKPSKYQKEIYKEVLNTKNNILINAGPGAGKTHTLVEMSKLLPQGQDNIFLAFNKSIVEELQKKVPSYIQCSTLHSLGAKFIFRHYGKCKVNQYKNFNFLQEYVQGIKDRGKQFYVMFICSQLIDLTRMNLLDFDKENLEYISNYYGIDVKNGEIDVAIKAFKKIDRYNNLKKVNGQREIDFTDMIYLPVVKDIKINKYDCILVDECQDLNNCQHEFIEKLQKKNSRLFACGDQAQSIYGFGGASSNSMDRFYKKDNLTSLDLPISYRCAQNIVLHANQVNNKVEAFYDNPLGEVREGEISEIREGDYVLCRNTRPLIDLYFKLLERDKKSFILGRDIEKNLLSLLDKSKDNDVEGLIDMLNGELYKMEQDLHKKGVEHPEKAKKYINLQDKVSVIEAVGTGLNSVSELKEKIQDIFDDSKEGVVLSTIHKAKGREADRVFILNRHLIPSEFAETEEDHEQERNLDFVARTRARKSLIYIEN